MTSVRWFRFLNNDKGDSLSRHYEMSGGLVVRREEPYRGNFYAWFRNHVDFNEKTRGMRKHFHEVITGRQKPYFDFDGTGDDRGELYSAVEEVCKALLRLLPVAKEDLLLFTSHGNGKSSAHLIVNGVAFRDHRQNKELYRLVCAEVSPRAAGIIDGGVYTASRSLRILGSSKLGEDRPKKFEKLVLDGEEVPFRPRFPGTMDMELLLGSLVSQVANCRLLPDLAPEDKPKMDEEDLDPGKAKEALKFAKSKMVEFPFKKRSVEGNVIVLQRMNSSLCPSCGRVHEHENPFIKINAIDVYFGCRRGKTIFLGQLGEDDERPLPFVELDKVETHTNI